jgi:hypothetical protein
MILGGIMKRFEVKWRFLVCLIALLGLFIVPYQARATTATSFSDTLSDSRPSTAVNQTILWTVVDSTGIQATTSDSFAITFDSNFTDSAITEDDVDIADDGADITTAADCSGSEKMSVANSSHVLTFTACSGDGLAVASGSVMTLKIGTNATQNGTGSHQITNPTAGFYTISLAGTNYTDSGAVQVAIITGVTTTASVSSSLSVTVGAIGSSQSVNGATTNIISTATTMPFAALTVATPKIGAHSLTISTNAAGGYTALIRAVTGSGYTNILADSSNNVDGFRGTAGTATNAAPLTWGSPTGSSANVDTGWYGYTTDDSSLGTGTPARFTSSGGNKWAPFSDTGYEVAYNSAPVSSEVTNVGHEIEVNGLQPQGSYTGTIEYIVTAIF